jgi:hypothetical protein
MKKNIDIVRDYLAGNRPITQFGYTGDEKYIIRKEGETWTDNKGREWVQKASDPQSVTKVIDIIRELSNQRCSKCNREIRWGSRQDEKMHAKTGMCLDCLVEEETMLRITGQYKNYERKKVLSNELRWLQDTKQRLSEAKEYVTEHKTFTYMNSNGTTEEWANDARDDVLKNLQKDFVHCLKEIDRVETELKAIISEMEKNKPTKAEVKNESDRQLA